MTNSDASDPSSSGDGVDHTGESDTSAGDTPRADADTFGVAIHVTDTELQFVVRVPSDIGSGWADPEEFQRLVERVVWETLDKEPTLRAIATTAETGETVSLGTVTLTPDGTLVDHSLTAPSDDHSAQQGA